jgi:hypothetical protein
MRRFVIERDLPAIGSADDATLQGAARTSCDALAKIGPKVQWIESYVAADKTFCIYLAEDEEGIRRHSELSGFPANKITEVHRMIDPTTAA